MRPHLAKTMGPSVFLSIIPHSFIQLKPHATILSLAYLFSIMSFFHCCTFNGFYLSLISRKILKCSRASIGHIAVSNAYIIYLSYDIPLKFLLSIRRLVLLLNYFNYCLLELELLYSKSPCHCDYAKYKIICDVNALIPRFLSTLLSPGNIGP